MRKIAKKQLDTPGNKAQGESGMKIFKDVSAKLKFIYKQRIFPLERNHLFHSLQNGPLEDGEFDAKPTVLLLGQYSTGKCVYSFVCTTRLNKKAALLNDKLLY